ncbi:hypothetical protein A3C67_00190 [Candidatus Nomurabacteria bacterium RIFCSPHIGHO2_02_FULL_42_19]|uniref:Uncharacterized protein n=1 Tax=Candidatus Nomurabacteria bacterium RIFCSPHIGHO2_02_FULL_42_19 TaxID=1801756 RepID=A0A1F6W3D2_9BACT|nr:MAG: hypothetical protein A3C67_00190 [Candidatus Nomurabacteria bacterium RIFCSPHIGHO2_02_FULL_42_19]
MGAGELNSPAHGTRWGLVLSYRVQGCESNPTRITKRHAANLEKTVADGKDHCHFPIDGVYRAVHAEDFLGLQQFVIREEIWLVLRGDDVHGELLQPLSMTVSTTKDKIPTWAL